MSSILSGIKVGLCWWDLVAVIVLIIMIVIFAINLAGIKKKRKALEDQLSDIYTKDALSQEDL